jgi:hypothetical protein
MKYDAFVYGAVLTKDETCVLSWSNDLRKRWRGRASCSNRSDNAERIRMEALARITIRNLLYTVLSFPLEVRADPWGRSYSLGLSVVKYFLGEEWIEQHLQPMDGATGFLQPDLTADDRESNIFARLIWENCFSICKTSKVSIVASLA